MHYGVAEVMLVMLIAAAICIAIIFILMICVPLLIGIIPGIVFIILFSIKLLIRQHGVNEGKPQKKLNYWELIVGSVFILFGALLYLVELVMIIVLFIK